MKSLVNFIKESLNENVSVEAILMFLNRWDGECVKICDLPADIDGNKFAKDLANEFDSEDVDYIYSEAFSEDGIGTAVMNRLGKAAGHKVIGLQFVSDDHKDIFFYRFVVGFYFVMSPLKQTKYLMVLIAFVVDYRWANFWMVRRQIITKQIQ